MVRVADTHQIWSGVWCPLIALGHDDSGVTADVVSEGKYQLPIQTPCSKFRLMWPIHITIKPREQSR